MIHTIISRYMLVKTRSTCIKSYLSFCNICSYVNMTRRLRLRLIFLASPFLCLSHLILLRISYSSVGKFLKEGEREDFVINQRVFPSCPPKLFFFSSLFFFHLHRQNVENTDFAIGTIFALP